MFKEILESESRNVHSKLILNCMIQNIKVFFKVPNLQF